MKNNTTIFTMLFVFIIAGASFAQQQGPPGHAKQHAHQGDDQEPPFVPLEKIQERFHKEFGVSAEVFKKVHSQLSTQTEYRGEGNVEKSDESADEKIRSNTIAVLILAITHVNAAEKKGEMKKENHAENILKRVNQILEQMKTASEGWGPFAHDVGFYDAGDLMSIKRSIDWGQPIPAPLKKKMGM